MSSTDKRLVMAATAAAVAIGGVAIYYGIRCTKNSKNANSSVDALSVPTVSKENLIVILDEITNQMSAVVVQLAKLEQKVRQESLAVGTPIPEDQLAAYLMSQFETAMKAVEENVYSKYSCKEEDIQLASEYYAEDPDVAAVVQKLKQLFAVIMGQPLDTVEVPDDLTLEKVVEIMEETMEAMNVAMENTCAELRGQGMSSDENDFQNAVNQIYIKRAEEATSRVHEERGITRHVLQAAMIKYQQDPIFLRRMGELQAEQNERFQAAATQLGNCP